MWGDIDVTFIRYAGSFCIPANELLGLNEFPIYYCMWGNIYSQKSWFGFS